MTEAPLIVTIQDAREAGLCSPGQRAWFRRHGLDFRRFLDQGIDAQTLIALDDAMADRAVRQAIARLQAEGAD